MNMRSFITMLALLFPAFLWARTYTLDASDTLRIKTILTAGLSAHTDVQMIPRWERRTHKSDFGPVPRLRTVGKDSLTSWRRVQFDGEIDVFICGYGDRKQGYYISAHVGGNLRCNFYWTESRLAIRIGLPGNSKRNDYKNLRCVPPDAVLAHFMNAAGRKDVKKSGRRR